MHTKASARGKGVAAAMVKHIISEARTRGYRRLSLETGADAPFAPARALYASFGFVLTLVAGAERWAAGFPLQ